MHLGPFPVDKAIAEAPHPPKQGLKHDCGTRIAIQLHRRRASSTKTRIETPHRADRDCNLPGRSASSTKTRIETSIPPTGKPARESAEAPHPPKQGLKPTMVGSFDPKPLAEEPHPPKQGLKPFSATASAREADCRSASSTKTRIETGGRRFGRPSRRAEPLIHQNKD